MFVVLPVIHNNVIKPSLIRCSCESFILANISFVNVVFNIKGIKIINNMEDKPRTQPRIIHICTESGLSFNLKFMLSPTYNHNRISFQFQVVGVFFVNALLNHQQPCLCQNSHYPRCYLKFVLWKVPVPCY